MPRLATNSPPTTLSVSALTAQIKGMLEEGFPSVWVSGEVSNFSRPQSGHCYFTLKDDNAQIRAVVWRGSAARLKFDLQDGLELICHGKVDVYGPRGSYQLVIDDAQPKGVGALELALRKLREKLTAEGLFDADRKRPLPSFPRRIGFVTSPTGAAVRDFLEVLARRWRGANVLVVPTRVQGEGSAKEIADAIRLANRLSNSLDVLVIGRGGGSLEDLWAFNEEAVVRAIAKSRVPTVSAVGHEIDMTLADLVADVRALTPSEAAERVVPSGEELRSRITTLGARAQAATRRRIDHAVERLEAIESRRPFARPHAVQLDLERRLDELEVTAARAARQRLAEYHTSLSAHAGKLESLSPLGVLQRGYSLTNHSDRLVRSIKSVKKGDRLVTRVADGQIISVVESKEKLD